MSPRPISPSMLRVLREAAAGTLVWQYFDPTRKWFGSWKDAIGRDVDRQVRALRRGGLLTDVGVDVTDAGRLALESAP